MSIFSNECERCHSKNHATKDCPHGLFQSKCTFCGSTEHSSTECPHGIFLSKCASCGSADHSTKDCPQGIFNSKCSSCGSKEHASLDCPHGFFSLKCGNCGSKDHSTANCPHWSAAGSGEPDGVKVEASSDAADKDEDIDDTQSSSAGVDSELMSRQYFVERMCKEVLSNGMIDLNQLRVFLQASDIFNKRPRLLWAVRRIDTGMLAPTSSEEEHQAFRSAVVEQYNNWAARIGAQYGADEAAAANMTDAIERVIPSGILFVIIFIFSSAGWFESLLIAALIGVPVYLIWSRIIPTFFGANFREFERQVLKLSLKVSESEAHRLVPNDYSWIWRDFRKGGFNYNAASRLSNQITGFKRLLREWT